MFLKKWCPVFLFTYQKILTPSDCTNFECIAGHQVGNNWMMIAFIIVTVQCEVTMVMTQAMQYTAIQIERCASLHAWLFGSRVSGLKSEYLVSSCTASGVFRTMVEEEVWVVVFPLNPFRVAIPYCSLIVTPGFKNIMSDLRSDLINEGHHWLICFKAINTNPTVWATPSKHHDWNIRRVFDSKALAVCLSDSWYRSSPTSLSSVYLLFALCCLHLRGHVEDTYRGMNRNILWMFFALFWWP